MNYIFNKFVEINLAFAFVVIGKHNKCFFDKYFVLSGYFVSSVYWNVQITQIT